MKRFALYMEASILPFLAAESILFVLASLCHILNQELFGARGDDYSITITAVILWGIVFAIWYHRETREEGKADRRELWKISTIIHFLFLGIGCQFLFSGGMDLLQKLNEGFFDRYTETIDTILGGNLFLVILYTIIIAPIAEEIVFRGVILHKACRNITFLEANILQSVFFGIYHQNIVQGIYAMILGFVLGFVCQKYHTLMAPILLHIFINAGAYLVMILPANDLGYVIMAVSGIIFIMLATNGLKLLRWKTTE